MKNVIASLVFIILSSLGLYSQQLKESLIVTEISFNVLKITKRKVVDREIVVELKDTLTLKQLNLAVQQSVNNLNNLRLFVDVSAEILYLRSNKVEVVFHVQERYYTLPEVIFKFEEPNFSTWWKEKNFSRTSYGLGVFRKNFRGRNETLRLSAQLGFTKRLSFSYSIPFINKKQTLGLVFNGLLDENDDVVYGTSGNKRLFFNDQANLTKEERNFGVNVTFRPVFHSVHSFGFLHRSISISDSLSVVNPDYLVGGATKRRFFDLRYQWLFIDTDNDSYSLVGHKADVKVVKHGLGIFGSAINVLTITPSYKMFNKLGQRWWLHTGIQLKYSWYNKLPYRLQEGLGFDEKFARGFEFYVVDGQHFALVRNNLKFSILPQRVVKIPYIKSPKFNKLPFAVYLNLITDAGYVRDNISADSSPLANTFLTSGGLGLDVVTAYDQVWRLEYSVNHLGEGGFYFAYKKSL